VRSFFARVKHRAHRFSADGVAKRARKGAASTGIGPRRP